MNNPKEKAKELVLKYSILKEGHNHLVKECAIIAVDEILDVIGYDFFLEKDWQEVKTEIEKL